MNENVKFTKELPERTAIDTILSVRIDGDQVILEPSRVHGVCGFTVTMSRTGAISLGYALVSAATRLLPPTTQGGA